MKKKLFILIVALIFGLTLVGCDNKPAYDMSEVNFEDKTFIYDGTPKSLEITGTLPEGVNVSYDGNEKTEVGVYTVTAKFSGDKSYEKIPSMSATMTISDPDSNKLPDLSTKSENDITKALNDQGYMTLKFEEVFNVSKFKGTFVGYKEYKVGQTVDFDNEITVLLASRKLPDLTKVYVEDIKQLFLDAGVKESNIIGVPQTEGDPEFGLGYYGDMKAGDEYTTGTIRYLYNSVDVKLKDLTGYSLAQIEYFLQKSNLTATFHDELDNTKEMDSFAGYVGDDIGDIVPRNTPIHIFLYKNDDLDDEKQLFISKHVDLEFGVNGLELYNPTDNDISLSDYYLSIFEDGSVFETYKVLLEGTIESKETYFIASNTANEVLKNKADLISDNLIFDGNDTIQLRKTSNNTYIDTVYNVGNTAFTMNDEIFVRRDDVTRGSRDYKAHEWAGFIPSFTEVIKQHPYVIEERPPFELLEATFQEYGMTKVRYKSAADGDTVYFESLDPRDTASYDGNSRVRFIMVNTPETDKPGVEGQPYAQAAKTFTINALSNALEIYLQSDRSAGLKENYGRHLGLVWYKSHVDQKWYLLNFELIYNGLGQAQGIKDQTGNYKQSAVWGNRYLYQWSQDADHHARVNELGIYSGVHQD